MRTRLGRLAEIAFGWPFASEMFRTSSDGGIRVIRIRDLSDDLAPIYSAESPRADARVQDGDILIGMDGDFVVHTWRRGTALLNQRVCRLRARPPNDVRYLAYCLPRPLAALQAVKFATTVKHLGSSDLAHLPIPVALPPRQRAIADFLDEECDRIAALDVRLRSVARITMESHAEKAREAIGVDRHTRAQARHVATAGTGHTPSRARADWWVPEDCVIPWFTLADVHQIRNDRIAVVHDTTERISAVGLANSSAVLHPAGTVLLSRTASVGFSAIMGVDMAVSQDFMTWTCGPRLDPWYLLHTLRATRPELRSLMYGSTHQTIYMPDLLALRIPLPSPEEQRVAVAVLNDLSRAHRAAAAVVEQMRACLAEYREALITEAVTGQLDVTAVSEQQMDERMHEAVEAPPG
ncbi:MAG: restriction endonuclease subunit S [Chloroflexota bacterium]|nr:restriction endonuclease subunit S [Chloroflexota bacterium]